MHGEVMGLKVNAIYKILALYNTPTWEEYTTGLLPALRSENVEYFHAINGLLQLETDGLLTKELVRKIVLDICNALNPRDE